MKGFVQLCACVSADVLTCVSLHTRAEEDGLILKVCSPIDKEKNVKNVKIKAS